VLTLQGDGSTVVGQGRVFIFVSLIAPGLTHAFGEGFYPFCRGYDESVHQTSWSYAVESLGRKR
jgi:hypothetical protein